MKKLLFFLSLFQLSTAAFSQRELTDIINGKTFLLDSKILNEPRRIFVSAPNLKDSLPVLYLISSGNKDFRASIFQQFLVIGIESPETKKDFLKASDRERFSQFLEKELIPYIEANYKTRPVRFLSGHSLSGGFTMDVFLKKPQLFSFYIATSPTLNIIDSAQTRKIQLIKETGLYFNIGDREQFDGFEKPVIEFSNRLKLSNVPQLSWKFEQMKDETHETNEYTGFCRGYSYYKSLITLPDSILGVNIREIINYADKLNSRFGAKIIIDENIVMPNILINNQSKNYVNIVDAVTYISEKLPDLLKEEVNNMIEIGNELQRNNRSTLALQVFKIIFKKTKNPVAGEKIKELTKTK